METTRIWVVAPSFRDVPSFLTLRQRLLEQFAQSPNTQNLRACFVLIDDTGGFDAEVERLRELPDTLTITPPFNLGHQRALVFGIRKLLPEISDSDLIVTMDADGEDRPEDVPRLIEPLLEGDHPERRLSVALRTQRQESFLFKLMYQIFRVMFRFLTGTTVKSGNFVAYRGWLARRMLLHPYFDLCYSSTLISLQLGPVMVPCARGSRYEGRSRMSPLGLFMHGVRMLMPFTDRIAARALAIFSTMMALGLFTSLAVVCIRIFTSMAIPGWTTFTLLGFLILSVVAFGNFVVLFAVFSHSRGISLAQVEDWKDKNDGI